MAKELGNKVNDTDAVKAVFKTVANAMTNVELPKATATPNFTLPTPNLGFNDCPECRPMPTLRYYRLFR
jgi:hypothetical protein